jgi:hypothetical protein
MNILADIQKRIPDRLFFRHLLPSLFYVSVAALGSALGQADWKTSPPPGALSPIC